MRTRFIKEFLAAFLLIIVSIGFGFSQGKNEKPNFGGTWNFDESKSRSYILGMDQSGFNKEKTNCSVVKVIEHQEPEIRIKTTSVCKDEGNNNMARKYELEALYYTDGRGETNEFRGVIVTSKTKWDGNKILIIDYLINPQNNKKKVLSAEEWSISKNKEEFSIKSAFDEASLYSTSSLTGNTYTKKIYKLSK